jgi:hypothetical protein
LRHKLAYYSITGLIRATDPQIAAFIPSERLCCPFFTFTLEITPARGPIWLQITGNAQVKTFLQYWLLGMAA